VVLYFYSTDVFFSDCSSTCSSIRYIIFHDSVHLIYRFGAELDIFATQSHAIGSGYLWASVAPPQKNQGGTSLSIEQVRKQKTVDKGDEITLSLAGVVSYMSDSWKCSSMNLRLPSRDFSPVCVFTGASGDALRVSALEASASFKQR